MKHSTSENPFDIMRGRETPPFRHASPTPKGLPEASWRKGVLEEDVTKGLTLIGTSPTPSVSSLRRCSDRMHRLQDLFRNLQGGGGPAPDAPVVDTSEKVSSGAPLSDQRPALRAPSGRQRLCFGTKAPLAEFHTMISVVCWWLSSGKDKATSHSIGIGPLTLLT